jgi:hypothetical protein
MARPWRNSRNQESRIRNYEDGNKCPGPGRKQELIEYYVCDLDDQPAENEIGEAGLENAALPKVFKQADVAYRGTRCGAEYDRNTVCPC